MKTPGYYGAGNDGGFWEPSRDKLTEKIRNVEKKGIPVIIVDGKIDGLPCYLNDDANAVEDVITHLVKDHGVRDIAYMTGIQGHFHAEHSREAFENAMKKLGHSVKENRIHYGDSGKELPFETGKPAVPRSTAGFLSECFVRITGYQQYRRSAAPLQPSQGRDR